MKDAQKPDSIGLVDCIASLVWRTLKATFILLAAATITFFAAWFVRDFFGSGVSKYPFDGEVFVAFMLHYPLFYLSLRKSDRWLSPCVLSCTATLLFVSIAFVIPLGALDQVQMAQISGTRQIITYALGGLVGPLSLFYFSLELFPHLEERLISYIR
jgi:hypothetical protein